MLCLSLAEQEKDAQAFYVFSAWLLQLFVIRYCQGALPRLQWIQNTAPQLIPRTKRYDNITPVYVSLYWLPVKFQLI